MAKLSFGDYILDTDALAPETAQKTIDYLLQYGFSQSMQDSYAGPRAKAAAAVKEGKATEADVAEAVKTALDARFAAIVAATVGTRGPSGPKASPFDREFYAVAKADLARRAKAKGKSLPKTKEGILELIEKAKNGRPVDRAAHAAWVEEANRRVNELAAIVADDDDDLFGDAPDAEGDAEGDTE